MQHTYTASASQHIEIFNMAHFHVDGEEVSMHEQSNSTALTLITGIASHLARLSPIPENDSTWQFTVADYCDYAEFYIAQKSWTEINLISQFYDGSDKTSLTCDAKAFYEAIIKFNQMVLTNIQLNETLLPRYKATQLSSWQNALSNIKLFYAKYYESK